MALPTKTETLAMLPAALGAVTLSDDAFTRLQGAALETIGGLLNCSPIVASASASVRYFDGFLPSHLGFLLRLQGSMIPRGQTAVVKTDWSVDDGTSPGSWTNTLTVDEDYFLRNSNVGPYHSILFTNGPSLDAKSIAISTRWGYCTEDDIPYALWSAIALQTCIMVIGEQGLDIGPVVKEKAGPVERTYGEGSSYTSSFEARVQGLLDPLMLR